MAEVRLCVFLFVLLVQHHNVMGKPFFGSLYDLICGDSSSSEDIFGICDSSDSDSTESDSSSDHHSQKGAKITEPYVNVTLDGSPNEIRIIVMKTPDDRISSFIVNTASNGKPAATTDKPTTASPAPTTAAAGGTTAATTTPKA